MKILLRSDVEGVGRKGDICEVADGFARNYLVPKGLAIKATANAELQAKAMRRARDQKEARDRGAAEEIATQLVSAVVTIDAKAGEGGRLFGSVTTSDISAAVLDQTGIEIDRRMIALEEPIKNVGSHQVAARLHAEVEFPITVEVVAS
ncbi:MAG: 50S ribosomal protein L9 [Acidimicrobiales bacterium]|nr:MAG: 50S ribosomal protein L9 [Actinomycetota bacterium]MBV6508367.1 50S ribosomal protein L9 [Acidimicrobiales bacterium]RIK04815.1 MAG: 50S ribosomal protein L9 [Acidobacteriota bacterium]